jgi:uncharacterized protein YcbX
MQRFMPEVGRIAALWRYPVKSMAAEPLDAIDVSWHGLAGDRRWAFVQDALVRSNFPWFTIRERSDMWHYRPRFAEPDRPEASATLVRTPSGHEIDVSDPALAAELAPGIRPIKQNRGTFDAMPLSLITTRTVADVGVSEPLRFRPNLLVESDSAEHEWVGATLRIGGMTMRVDERDTRCVIVNVDPATAERDPRVLRRIAQERETCAGVYGSVVEPGRVAVGDAVTQVTRRARR